MLDDLENMKETNDTPFIEQQINDIKYNINYLIDHVENNENIPINNIQKNYKDIEQKRNYNIIACSSISFLFCLMLILVPYVFYITQVIDKTNMIYLQLSIIILTKTALYVLRDSYGYKPLSLGKINDDYCVSSEDCVEDFIKIRDIQPGEILKINEYECRTIYHKNNRSQLKCIFEFIYFMNENTTFNNHQVYDIRRKMGHELALTEEYTFVPEDTILPYQPISIEFAELSFANLNMLSPAATVVLATVV